MPYVFSTLTNASEYCAYRTDPTGRNMPVLEKTVKINGGTGVAQGKALVTPYGVATFVTDEDLGFLKDSKAFQRHMKHGYLSVREKMAEPETVAADMRVGDGCSPVVPQDFNDKSKVKPSDLNDNKKFKIQNPMMKKFIG